MSAECRKCGRDLDGDFKCGACDWQKKSQCLQDERDYWRSAHKTLVGASNELIDKYEGALKLAVYYVEGDATYEGLIQQIKDKFGIEIK